MKSHRAFPPGIGNLKIPISSRQGARAGLALYAPCRPSGRLARWVAWRVVDLLGARALPGSSVDWVPPMDREVWNALAAQWKTSVGSFDEVAVYERIQLSRSGFAALLLTGGNPVGFVKVRDGDRSPLQNEFTALSAMRAAQPRSFEIPRLIALSEVGGWNYLLTSALEPVLHRMPTEPPLDLITAEIQSGLQDLPRLPEIPEHWRPMHGDLTPWNLRQKRDGTLLLIDWEDAGWAPPGADEMYYRASWRIVGGPTTLPQGSYVEAGDFLRSRTAERLAGASAAGDLDQSVNEAILAELDLRTR